MECEFCKSILSNKSNLTFHIANNKRCISIQKKCSDDVSSITTNLKDCEFCNKSYNSTTMKKHLQVCKMKKQKEYDNEISDMTNKYEGKISDMVNEYEEKISDTVNEYEEKISDMTNKYEEKISDMTNKYEEKISDMTDKYEEKISDMTDKYEEKISDYEKEIVELKRQISELNTQNIKLETEKNIYEKHHDVVLNLAQQPKVTNTNNNQNNNYVNNLAVYDNKTILDRFTNMLNNITAEDLYDGQESISRFVAPCLKNEDGKNFYLCSDYSRGVYVRKDENGNIVRDINCINLAGMLEPLATKKAEEIFKEDCKKRQKQSRLKELNKNIEKQNLEVENLKDHMTGYRKNSNKWMTFENRIKEIEEEIDKDVKEKRELEYEGVICGESDDLFDMKLSNGIDDIKMMKTDCSKFSKKLSKMI